MTDFNDTYFFDKERAKEVAMQQNRVVVSDHHTALQICYYDGLPFDNSPQNLINVPFEKFVDFFSDTELRLPVDFVGIGEDNIGKAKVVVKALSEIKKIRTLKANCYGTIISKLKPDFKNDTPWRIVFAVSRHTDVWQYCIKNLAREFQKRGYNIKIIIEKDEMHCIDSYIQLKHIAEFKPHIIVAMSNPSPNFLHPDIYFVCWWQDITPQLRTAKKINWRDRDLVFAQSFTADEVLIRTNMKNFQRQGIGVDPDVYRPIPGIIRERKVVFIGSSYINAYLSLPKCKGDDEILNALDEVIRAGSPITMEVAEYLAKKHAISSNLIFEKHAAYLVRERVIEWLCQYEGITVEIYGRYWERNSIVKPFFKGELPYGESVARVYNEAMYAISAVPRNITIQRVVEMAACGCIPVVYDCRHIAEKPHWDNECLFFRSREELQACFDKVPAGNPLDIAKSDSYENFAEKILAIIREREGVTGL